MDCEPVRAEGKKRIRREEKEKNMNRLVLKHCLGGIEHLSFISGPHFSPTDSIPLPFNRDDEIRGCPDAYDCNDGLRYNPVSDDYKVIRNQDPATTAEVYSLKNDSWNVIPGPGDDVSMDAEAGVYMKEC
ncbi:hypothetical protein OROHE_010936 [Orobanche hederae]